MIADGKRYIVHPSRSDVFKLWNIADVHFGNIGCAKDLLHQTIAQIADDPYSFVVLGGDQAEYIRPTDRRFDAKIIDPSISIADLGELGMCLSKHLRDIFRPIAHKCFGSLFGNHEYYYMNQNAQQDLHAWLCTELGIPNLGFCAMFDLVFIRDPSVEKPMLVPGSSYPNGLSRQAFRIFLHHGAGAANTHGGKINRLAGFMNDFEADIYFIGHVHDQKGLKLDVLAADAACQKITSHQRVGTITGGFLRTYKESKFPGYGEMRGYRPTPLGAACVEIKPETRELWARI